MNIENFVAVGICLMGAIFYFCGAINAYREKRMLFIPKLLLAIAWIVALEYFTIGF